jgi:hypothetical protein
MAKVNLKAFDADRERCCGNHRRRNRFRQHDHLAESTLSLTNSFKRIGRAWFQCLTLPYLQVTSAVTSPKHTEIRDVYRHGNPGTEQSSMQRRTEIPTIPKVARLGILVSPRAFLTAKVIPSSWTVSALSEHLASQHRGEADLRLEVSLSDAHRSTMLS